MEQANKKESRLPILRQRLNNLLGDMSTTDFAKKVGISRQTMGFYLNGDRIPDAATLHQICTACDISADWLLGLSDTKSIDPNIKTVTQYTGLTEENASFLHDPSGFVGNDEPLNLHRKSLYMLVNDLLLFCRSTDAHLYFFQIQHALSLFKGVKTPYSGHKTDQLFAEGIASNRGYAVLPVNDSIAFYASLVAKNIAEAIENKYRVAEKTEPDGKLEIMEINGKKGVGNSWQP